MKIVTQQQASFQDLLLRKLDIFIWLTSSYLKLENALRTHISLKKDALIKNLSEL